MSLSPLPPGFVLSEPRGSLGKRLVGIGLAAPVVFFFCVAFFGFGAAIVLIAVGLGLVVLVSKDSLLATLRWDRPLLQLLSTPYELGSVTTIVYRRKPKRVVDISSCTVECRLVCEERVTYTQGTDTRTDTRQVFESQSSGIGEGTAEGVVAEVELNISRHLGAPSFKLPNNEVVWHVEIGIVGPRLPRDSHTFEIDVGAVLDQRYRVQVQDT